jgi:hypothetical protein
MRNVDDDPLDWRAVIDPRIDMGKGGTVDEVSRHWRTIGNSGTEGRKK